MHIINIDRITVNHAGRLIFKDLTWAIGDHDRIGLVGPNGAGKSSLLKAILGELPPDTFSGIITRIRGVTVGYLSQEPKIAPGRTLITEAMILPSELAQADADLHRIEAQLGEPNTYNNPNKLARALERQEKLLAEYERLGGLRHESKVRELLAHLGFTEADYDLPTHTLSGGQKKLVALARLAAEQPSVLLLDEPDNHLDLDAKRLLEIFIKNYAGSVIIVSHDRYLLDNVAQQIAELENGTLTVYAGNYSAYATERELRRLRQQQMYAVQQRRIAQIEAAIHEWEMKARSDLNERHARQAASRRKMLARMEERGEVIDRVVERRLMELQLDGWRGSTKAVEARNLSMGFGNDLLFLDINFLVRHGERVGLVGPNGAGKSVLFRLLLGQHKPLEGEIKCGPSTRIGYYSQEHETLGDWLHRTPLERVRDAKPMNEGEAVAFLLKFQFKYEQVRMPIRSLSGGERSRLQLAVLMLEQPNLLLLDEPTNNLDIPSVEALESALDDFDGAILTISHDRYFLDRVVDRVLELDGGLRSFEGGYTDYLDIRDKPHKTVASHFL